MSRTIEQNRTRIKAWKKANPEKHKAQQERYRLKNPGKIAGLTRAWRRKKLVEPVPYEPPTGCEACGKSLVKPCLDHCHMTNMFRGWLCNPCNSALGLAGDTPEGVRKLLDYIERAYDRMNERLKS